MSNELPSDKKKEELKTLMKSLDVFEDDLEETFVHGSGKGGQKQNKTNNCVILKHSTSQMTIKCQKSRSRELNRFFARRLLCEKLDTLKNGTLSQKAKNIAKIQKQKKKRKKRHNEKSG
ncbi:peptide chain release factor-like protein [Candidatus Marinamargulisbacteria bacterium SCGC AAA071-K20]|nr:peptide chain release factor-like protein [Candidatus Marinamargulisbacteria bacterium SCGC AAA071-K20]